ncbi:MAG: DUF5666 domain-containing protein [Pseudomonadota bacterium]
MIRRMMCLGASVRIKALSWLLIAALAGCAAQPSAVDGLAAGSGGEGEDETDGGFGGTGILGAVTAVEIDGTTRLAVNGFALQARRGSEVASALGPIAATELQPGEVILAEALSIGDATDLSWTREGFVAAKLARYVPVAGVIEAVEDEGRRLRILGIDVTVPADTPLGGAASSSPLKPGLRVAVSGFWQGSGVLATHLRVLPSDGPSVVSGPARRTAEGALAVGGITLVLPQGVTEPIVTATLAAKGRYRAGRLEAATLFQDLASPPRGAVASLSVQGFPVSGPIGQVLAGQPDLAVSGGKAGTLGIFVGPAALGAIGGERAATVAPSVARGLRARTATLSRVGRVGARAAALGSVLGGTFDGPVANAIASGVLGNGIARTIGAGLAEAVGRRGIAAGQGAAVGRGTAVGRDAIGRGAIGRGGVGAGAADGPASGPAGRGRGRGGIGGRGGRGGPAGGRGGRGRR